MKMIHLTRGKSAILDDYDYQRINVHRWHAKKQITKSGVTWYAARTIPQKDGTQKTLYMHREILGITNLKIKTDHANGNGLNNRRNNLRQATYSQNAQNKVKTTGCSSAFKGVHWHKRHQKWMAKIKLNGRIHHLGYHNTEEAAAAAYNRAAKQKFNKFAALNQI